MHSIALKILATANNIDKRRTTIAAAVTFF